MSAMNTLPAKEIKRRGIAAVDKALKKGPVHIVKNNRPQYVVMREEDYQRQARRQGSSKRGRDSLWDFLMNPPWPAGTRTKKEIDDQIAEERASWGDR